MSSVELRPEVREFAEWVEMQMRDQEEKNQEWGYTPPKLVSASRHGTCLTSIGMAYVNPKGSEILGEVHPVKITSGAVY